MRISKKDITAFFVLFLGTIVCVRYFYKHMNDEQFVATVDPYSLVVPSPTAIFAINRPPVFEKMILPMENIRKAFSDHTPAIFLSLIQQNPDLSSFLIAYYPQGDILYAPMDSHTAERIFKQLDASFTFPAQQREEASVPVRYYPDVDKHFLGCYYHEGIFVVSYNRKLLVETAKKQQMYPAQIIPELADLMGFFLYTQFILLQLLRQRIVNIKRKSHLILQTLLLRTVAGRDNITVGILESSVRTLRFIISVT